MIGLGGGGLSFVIQDERRRSFNDVLDQPANISSLSAGGMIIDASLGFDYQFSYSEEHPYGGMIVGIMAGYSYMPWSQWTMNNQYISHGPFAGINGPYVRLLLGFGGGRPGRSYAK